ncbi:DUF397 domain-containing protein [Amycolatopsis antarctica]|uniref:DUF397 domain-containing protein n=1 Tax=Amycolatopsis antarctica TaxID=1854586 RepID=A0A263D9F7_9PSEU|nr:DUF397 domain-containing protein [Amycolatopsis antarctica]
MDPARCEWRKATASNNNAQCVEVTRRPGLTGVRDTKDRGGGFLVFSQPAWQALLRRL